MTFTLFSFEALIEEGYLRILIFLDKTITPIINMVKYLSSVDPYRFLLNLNIGKHYLMYVLYICMYIYMYICIKGSGTYPCTRLSKRFLTEVYKNTKRNTSALARTVRSVTVTLTTV